MGKLKNRKQTQYASGRVIGGNFAPDSIETEADVLGCFVHSMLYNETKYIDKDNAGSYGIPLDLCKEKRHRYDFLGEKEYWFVGKYGAKLASGPDDGKDLFYYDACSRGSLDIEDVMRCTFSVFKLDAEKTPIMTKNSLNITANIPIGDSICYFLAISLKMVKRVRDKRMSVAPKPIPVKDVCGNGIGLSSIYDGQVYGIVIPWEMYYTLLSYCFARDARELMWILPREFTNLHEIFTNGYYTKNRNIGDIGICRGYSSLKNIQKMWESIMWDNFPQRRKNMMQSLSHPMSLS